MTDSRFNLNNYKVAGIPPKAYYISEYISREEENAIISSIYSSPKPKWTQLSNRRLQNWGGIPHVNGMIAEDMPAWLNKYLERIHDLKVMGENKPNHVLVNEYLAGQGIMPHLDGALFYPTITTISVGSHTVLKFLEPVKEGYRDALKHVFSFLLEPRSLLVLQERLFTTYLHCIEEKEMDALDSSVVNLSLCSNNYCKDEIIKRDKRISLTIRHVPKTTQFKIQIGNKLFKKYFCGFF